MESAARREGASAFLREALAPLFTRAMLAPVLILTVLLTATNIVLASHVPPPGAPAPPLPFILAGFVRVAGLLVLAVATPLALRPGPWLRDFGRWLPYYLLWTILLAAPPAALHAWLDEWLVRGAGDLFWPIALLDGPLSLVVAMLGFGLAAAAYRRVAQR